MLVPNWFLKCIARTLIIEREEAERKTELINNKLNELANQVTEITGTKIVSSVAGLELLIKKISEIVDESTMIKGKLMTTTEGFNSNVAENKANRETITRLVNEINKFEKDSANTKVDVDKLRAVFIYSKFLLQQWEFFDLIISI